jgi:hypothetical protein
MARRYDLAMGEPVAEELSADVQRIVQGYTFDEPAIELGVLMENDAPVQPAIIGIPLSMLNRHGLVAGATGTGKTKTLQLMAEQICAAGVPVFAADIKVICPASPHRDSPTTSCWGVPRRSARTGSQEPARRSSSPSAARAMACRCAPP